MSPRPTPTRTDATAETFLRAALRLLDASFVARPREELPPRLRALHFPAPLDWVRIEDVIREAHQDRPTLSAKAFWNRWPDKDTFLVDVCLGAMKVGSTPHTQDLRVALSDSEARFSEQVRLLGVTAMGELMAWPRSYLLGFLAPIMQASPVIADAVVASTARDVTTWVEFYDAAVAGAGLRWRPGWDAGRAQVVVQSLIDGILVRERIVPLLPDGSEWDPVTTFADAVTALFVGILDLDDDGRTAAEALDDGVAFVAGRAGGR